MFLDVLSVLSSPLLFTCLLPKLCLLLGRPGLGRRSKFEAIRRTGLCLKEENCQQIELSGFVLVAP